ASPRAQDLAQHRLQPRPQIAIHLEHDSLRGPLPRSLRNRMMAKADETSLCAKPLKAFYPAPRSLTTSIKPIPVTRLAIPSNQKQTPIFAAAASTGHFLKVRALALRQTPTAAKIG